VTADDDSTTIRSTPVRVDHPGLADEVRSELP
jgi:hypothetical protein